MVLHITIFGYTHDGKLTDPTPNPNLNPLNLTYESNFCQEYTIIFVSQLLICVVMRIAKTDRSCRLDLHITSAFITSCARGDTICPRPLYARCCGLAESHPLRLQRPACLASSSCGHYEYSRCMRQRSSEAHHRLVPHSRLVDTLIHCVLCMI